MSEARMPGHLLAVDPGSDKCGIAVVDAAEGAAGGVANGAVVGGNQRTILKEVIPAGEALSRVQSLVEKYPIRTIVVGDRTGGKAFARELEHAGFIAGDCPVVLVDEHLSSQEGRRRYLKDHPGRGLARLLPDSLRVPAEPFDDYVAEILAERYLHGSASSKTAPPKLP
ncbi:MAG: hypothetical protein M1379_16165 [Firmicutes bacterium]|nr:hypothetical protein [Bacillota bacterium]